MPMPPIHEPTTTPRVMNDEWTVCTQRTGVARTLNAGDHRRVQGDPHQADSRHCDDCDGGEVGEQCEADEEDDVEQ